jgi:hypothetical protein
MLKTDKKILEEHSKIFLNLNFGIDHLYEDLTMTTSWANKTEPKRGHHPHVHSFSIVTGVLFLEDNPSNLNLNIQVQLPTIPHFMLLDTNYKALSDVVDKDKPNNYLGQHLVLFLSNSYHYVSPVPVYCGDRKTVSFNTFWKGKVGNVPLGIMDFNKVVSS